MSEGKKYITPSLYGIIIICFFLPFVIVSCEGKMIQEFTGMQMAVGTTVQTFSGSHRVNPDPCASIALIITIIGLILGLSGKGREILLTAASAIGVIMLLLVRSNVVKEMTKQGMQMLNIEFGAAYYISIILFLIAALFNLFQLATMGGISQLSAKRSASIRYCTLCGSKNSQGNIFCNECGAKFT
jgi:cell division protein FtsX